MQRHICRILGFQWREYIINALNIFRENIKSRSKSLLVKMFLSLIVLSLLIITIFGIFTYYFISHNLNSEIDKFEQKKLFDTLNKTNILFDEMKKLTLCYEVNSSFMKIMFLSPKNIPDNYININNNISVLSSIATSSKYIKNIFIYYQSIDYLLGNIGFLHTDSYFDQEWKKAFNLMTGNFMILDTRKLVNPDTNNKVAPFNNIFTLITRIPYDYNMKEGAIILDLDSRLVSDLLINLTKENSNTFSFLVNEKGIIIASSNEDYLYHNISEIVPISKNIFTQSTGKFNYSLNKNKMIAYFQTSNINNWKLIYTVPKNIIFNESNNLQIITLLTILLLLLLTTFISLIFSFKIYNPIKSIIDNIKSMKKFNDVNISEISIIQNSLDYLKNLEEQLNQNKIQAKEIFLSQLFTGKLFNKTEIKNKAEYFQVDLDFINFKVATIQNSSFHTNPINIEEYETKKITIINIAKNVFDNLHLKYIFSQDLNDNILILFKLPDTKELGEIDSIIEHAFEIIKSSIEKYLDLNISVGIGRTYNNLSSIGISCREASEALQYKFLKGNQSVISINDINEAGKHDLYYPIDIEQKLISIVKSCDYDKVITCLNYMINDIMTHNKAFEHIEICLSNITGIIQRCLFELNVNSEDVFNEKLPLNFSIEHFKNTEQYIEWISTKLRKIIEYQIEQEKGNINNFTLKIKEYIEKKYMEEISLSLIASHFNYNPSYFGKIFKEKTGISYWEYVAKFRIEKSKKFLMETEDSIEQIASLIGYNNRFSYIRAFKKFTFVTPGEFRQNHRLAQADSII